MIARHCSGDDTATHEVWEIDKYGLTFSEVKAAYDEFMSEVIGGRDYTVESTDMSDDDEPFNVDVYTVSKSWL